MRLAAVLLLVACASRADRLRGLSEEGRQAEVIAKVDGWEAKGRLDGKDADAVRAVRDEAALALAARAETSAAYGEFVARYPDSPRVADATGKQEELAYAEAGDAGTSAAMRAFRDAWPNGVYGARARGVEEGLAFQEAGKDPTGDAMRRFLADWPDTAFRGSAWETMVAHSDGVVLLGADGQPIRIPPVPVVDGKVQPPRFWPVGPARPRFAVNVAGAGNGTTSSFWRLEALDADGRVGAVAPLAARAADAALADPPTQDLLGLVAAPGMHIARVAESAEPLLVAEGCIGRARFALVLERPGEAMRAWPFAVDCPAFTDTAAAFAVRVLDAAEAGRLDRETFDRLQALADPGPWKAWLDWERMVVRHPAKGDLIAWAPGHAWWVHAVPDAAPVVLAEASTPVAIVAGEVRALSVEPACGGVPELLGLAMGALWVRETGCAPEVRAVDLTGAPVTIEPPPPEWKLSKRAKAEPLGPVADAAGVRVRWRWTDGSRAAEVDGPIEARPALLGDLPAVGWSEVPAGKVKAAWRGFSGLAVEAAP